MNIGIIGLVLLYFAMAFLGAFYWVTDYWGYGYGAGWLLGLGCLIPLLWALYLIQLPAPIILVGGLVGGWMGYAAILEIGYILWD